MPCLISSQAVLSRPVSIEVSLMLVGGPVVGVLWSYLFLTLQSSHVLTLFGPLPPADGPGAGVTDAGAPLLLEPDNPYQLTARRRARLTPIKACIALNPPRRRAGVVGVDVGRSRPPDGGDVDLPDAALTAARALSAADGR